MSSSLLSLSLQRLKRHTRVAQDSTDGRPLAIIRPPRNAWREAHADKVSFLIDGDAFFRAFAEAAEAAHHQIFIVGWDIDSRTEIPLPGHRSAPLGAFLKQLTERRPELRIYVLTWDFSFIYLFEREPLPSIKFAALEPKGRIRFVLDREHPTLASHHQKIVVVDDKVAFAGGLDLTQRRWDTPEHKAHDERRVDPGGHSYGPFHDVQIGLEGEAAQALGEIARGRWRQATGETIQPPPPDPAAIWPLIAPLDIEHIPVGIARTLPPGQGAKPVLEVERLFIDAIRAARKHIYIENQYFTSELIARALARRLREPDGPEIVLILPRDQTGWIEESTMGLLRSRALRIVGDSDRHGRFRCYYPVVSELEDGYVKVHSKVMIIDDEFVRIGSANLNNRSMGLDTECDIAIEARGRIDCRTSIARLRRKLLGEHLDVDPAEFDARFIINGSLVDTIESFRKTEGRTLIELGPTVPEWVAKVSPPGQWLDPAVPNGIRRWFKRRVRDPRFPWAVALVGLITGFLTALTLAGPIGSLHSLDAEQFGALVRRLADEPGSGLIVSCLFVVGSLLFVPVTAMILGVALAYRPVDALAIAFAGSLLSSLALYAIGRFWAGTKSRYLSKPWVKKFSEQIQNGGVWAVMMIRLTPIAPFTAVGIVAGALRIPVRAYVVGTALGLAPGILAITVLSSSAMGLGRDWGSGIAIVFFLIAAIALATKTLRRVRRDRKTGVEA